MKKHFSSLGILAVVGLTLLACQNKEIDFVPSQTDAPVFYASIEEASEPDTRVYVDENLRLLWHADDRVSIFNKYTFNQQYRFDGETGANAGTFTIVPDGSFVTGNTLPAIYAVYPYNETTSITNDCQIELTLPSEQEYAPMGFGPGANTMVSATEDNNLMFKNLGGFLVIKLYGDDLSVSKVTLRGNNGEKLAGKARVTATLDGDPTVVMDDDATYEITVNCTAPVTIGKSPEDYTEFWFVLPPTVFEQGFTITVSDENGGLFEKATSKAVTISRNRISRMSAIKVQPDDEHRLAVERNVLMAFYRDLDGDHWFRHDNWCSEKPVGEWFGITTDTNGFVTQIDFGGTSNNLAGTIPESLSYLTYLERLVFQGNENLSGNILRIVNGLNRLKYLLVFGNKFTIDLSFLPKEAIQMTELELSGGEEDFLGVLPEELGIFYPNIRLLSIGGYSQIGEIPASIGLCRNLEWLQLRLVSGGLPAEIGNLTNLRYLFISGDFGQGSVKYPMRKSIPESLGNLKNLEQLDIANVYQGGPIPESIGNLVQLRSLTLRCDKLTGGIPSSIGELKYLQDFNLSNNMFTGGIPETIGNMTSLKNVWLGVNLLSGGIPEQLGDCENLSSFTVGNNCLSGEIPQHIQNCSQLIDFSFSQNAFSGPYPQWMLDDSRFKDGWCGNKEGNRFDFSEVTITAPTFRVVDLDGNTIVSNEEYSKNVYTIFYVFGGCHQTTDLFVDELKAIYNSYRDKGVEIIGMSGSGGSGMDEWEVREFVEKNHIPWRTVHNKENNHFSEISVDNCLRLDMYPNAYIGSIFMVDSDGQVVYFDDFGNRNVSGDFMRMVGILTDRFGGNPLFEDGKYTSVDYSSDGAVSLIQEATEGGGLPLIFLGDGYSDRLIADGTYDNAVRKAIDALFKEEPYRSYKDYFNIYSVNVVSPNEYIPSEYETAYGTTGLSTWRKGNQVGGDHRTVLNYAQTALPPSMLDDALIVVLMNIDLYAGTCYLFKADGGDYGRGMAIAYIATCRETDTFSGLVSHEAGGHGFPKLADEYAYEYMGAIWRDDIYATERNGLLGWWKNIDFTGDPLQVKWHQFISDERYANENIGCYEGAFTYWTGVWRPTENSIMNTNTGGYNAPSRYAIWYRINKLAYGESWNGTYEDFVAYDAVNRTPSAIAGRKARNYVEKALPPLAPPVVVGHSWRDEM